MKKSSARIVLHVDLDAFFAAVEERDHPAFRGFPIVVGADPKDGKGRGVVSTANYAARKYGVHSALPISKAWQLCKEEEENGGKPCIFFQGNFEKYGRESEKVMGIIQKTATNLHKSENKSTQIKFEQAGIDEAYLGLGNREQGIGYRDARRIAQKIKRNIYKETGLTCSVGVGPNKLVAKIASDFKKPDGLTVVLSEKVQGFLDPMPVTKIPGIGPKTDVMLEKYGIRTVKQLRTTPKEKLIEWFGKWGEGMYDAACGRDGRPVGELHETKSIGREHTFEEDTLNAQELIAALKALATKVAKDVTKESVSFRTMELKIRFEGFITKTRAKTLPQPGKDATVLERVGITLLLSFLDRRENPQQNKIRLVGLRVSNLV